MPRNGRKQQAGIVLKHRQSIGVQHHRTATGQDGQDQALEAFGVRAPERTRANQHGTQAFVVQQGLQTTLPLIGAFACEGMHHDAVQAGGIHRPHRIGHAHRGQPRTHPSGRTGCQTGRPGHERAAPHQRMASVVLVTGHVRPRAHRLPHCGRVFPRPRLHTRQHSVADADVGQHPLATQQTTRHQEVPRFEPEERDRQVAVHSPRRDATVAPDTAGHVDRDDGQALGLRLGQDLGGHTVEWAGQARAEQGIHHQRLPVQASAAKREGP